MAEVNGLRIAVLKRTATARITGVVRGFQYQSEFTIPTQVEEKGMTFRVTEIDDAAFRNCSALTSITIPEGIVRIGKLAFVECFSLTSITIPNSVTSIGEWAFGYCSSLTSITIPNSVTSIGYHAFRYCKALTSITIPNSVTSIGCWAFCDCDALTFVTIENEEGKVAIGRDAFPSKAKINYVGKPKDGVEKIVRIMVEVPTLLALLDGKATEKEVQAICQQVKTLGEDAENLEKRLKKCIK